MTHELGGPRGELSQHAAELVHRGAGVEEALDEVVRRGNPVPRQPRERLGGVAADREAYLRSPEKAEDFWDNAESWGEA